MYFVCIFDFDAIFYDTEEECRKLMCKVDYVTIDTRIVSEQTMRDNILESAHNKRIDVWIQDYVDQQAEILLS